MENYLDSKSNSNSGLEDILTSIEVHKFGKPILDPFCKGYLSIRNPAAFIYQNKIGLLFTVRDCPKKSCLYLAWSQDGENFELEKKPFIGLDKDARKATEDARITKIKREYFITFTAFKGKRNGKNILRVGFAKTKDFKNYYNRQIILDSKGENKNALFFKNEKYHFIIDRPFMKKRNETPGAQIALVKDLNSLDFGEFKDFLLPRENSWDNARVGINTPPIKCWHENYGKTLFMLYHGADKETNTYRIGYIITDEKDPTKILERSAKPLVEPELDFEIGNEKYPPEIPNVIFGCGAIPMNKNTIRFYYSGADRYPSFADLKLKNIKILSRTLNQKLIN